MKKAAETEAAMVAEAEQKARVMIGEAWTEGGGHLDGALLVTDEADRKARRARLEKMVDRVQRKRASRPRRPGRPAPPAAVAG